MLENQEIILENEPYEGNCVEYFEENGVITGRCGTETIEGTTLKIEKIYFYEPFYNEKEVSDAFAEEFVFDEKYETENKNLTIIGHPVMIGDVMDYFDFHIFDHGSYGYEVKTDFYHINGVWKNKRKSIEEQSDECIEFIYNLISE